MCVCMCVCVCVCSGCTLCYIGVYQCGLCSVVQVCVGTGGLWSPVCGRGVCSGGWWWGFKVLGVVCVCDQVCVGCGCLVWWLGYIVAMGV